MILFPIATQATEPAPGASIEEPRLLIDGFFTDRKHKQTQANTGSTQTEHTHRHCRKADGLRCPVCIERLEPHAWDSAGGRQSSSASAQTTGDPGADLRSLRWPETAERFNTDMLNMMALTAASPPSEQALGGRVRCHIRGRKLNQSE